MPLNIAVLKHKEDEDTQLWSIPEGTQEEVQEGRPEYEVVDFIRVEGRLADALSIICDDMDHVVGGVDPLWKQLDELLTRVYSMRREELKPTTKKHRSHRSSQK